MAYAATNTSSVTSLNQIARGFIAGFASTLMFHQGMLMLLHSAGLAPNMPFVLQPTQPLGVPEVYSLAFWGGAWGIVFLSARPEDEHHEMVLQRGATDGPGNRVNQISWRLESMEALRAFDRRFAEHDVRIQQKVTHGNALSIYFFDPEGNRLLGSVFQVQMSVPIWNWGATQSKLRQAGLRIQQAKNDLTLAERQLLASQRAFHGEAEAAAIANSGGGTLQPGQDHCLGDPAS